DSAGAAACAYFGASVCAARIYKEIAAHGAAGPLDLRLRVRSADADLCGPGRADEHAVYNECNDEHDGFAHRNLPRGEAHPIRSTLLPARVMSRTRKYNRWLWPQKPPLLAAAPAQEPRGYCPVSKLHCAPPPAFCMISFGSIVHRSLETLSMLEPAAPSEGMPPAPIVPPTSFASPPLSVRLRAPKLSSQLREVMSTLLTRQMTESASTEIFLLGVKPKLVLPRKRRAMTRLSNARTAGECCAITAAKAKALGPLAVPGAANAVLCTTMSAKAGIKAGMISFFISAASIPLCAGRSRACGARSMRLLMA